MTQPLDVLVVGAGPTGHALAAQLSAYGVAFRIVDRSPDRVRESRALVVQPRTLEMLAALGATDALVARGNPAMRLRLHAPGRVAELRLFDTGTDDTAYPFLLFLSQAETERVLSGLLTAQDVTVERGTELLRLEATGPSVTCRLRHADGARETVTARYVAGCDGAHSTVREQSGIPFEGRAYPQTFLLADLEVDGLEPGSVHSYMTGEGMVFFFPLGSPAGWRLLAVRPPDRPGTDVDLPLLQETADRGTGGQPLVLRDPVWMTSFRLHNRGAARYRSGRCFLAAGAAHIHSPAGGQGMNTGIQDALNLGWKLALVLRGAAPGDLLDTYEAERAPVGRGVRALTDRAFSAATGTHPVLRFGRTRVAPLLAPLLLRPPAVRRRLFRTVSELGIHYRSSPLSTAGSPSPRGGPKAGDRLPDRPHGLHARTAAPGWHLLLTGPPRLWPDAPLTPALDGRNAPLSVHHLGAGSPWRGVAHALVRPDGHVGYAARGTDLGGLLSYLDRWAPAGRG
ncbi:monooxygenase [Streptomyces sp. SID9913]|uniref:FAD-dependent monooxygenase n=1 Tax=Streptomyces sp. SID9913 TaxID=2706117 RepID=UPI0013D99989|nr:FAD-dependent monooxygenase [Streptomyces sp. SID9913]NED18705.1 monooxygenase [Streptomyces sp. SID9913]